MWIIIIIVKTELWEIHSKLAIIHKRQLICKLQTASPRNLQNLLTWTESKLLWTKIKKKKKHLNVETITIACHEYAFSLPIHDACTMAPRMEQLRKSPMYCDMHTMTLCQNQVIPPNITTTDKHTLNTFPVYSSFFFRVLSMLLQSDSPRCTWQHCMSLM